MKRKTTITLSVKMELPVGTTGADAIFFVRAGLAYAYKSLKDTGDFKMNKLDPETIKVSMLKKETTYQ